MSDSLYFSPSVFPSLSLRSCLDSVCPVEIMNPSRNGMRGILTQSYVFLNDLQIASRLYLNGTLVFIEQFPPATKYKTINVVGCAL